MTCKDCISYDVCVIVEHLPSDEEDYYTEFGCDKFKNKADYAKVVRCKGCDHYIANYCTRDINGRTNMFYMTDNDFCSYGTIKDGGKEE